MQFPIILGLLLMTYQAFKVLNSRGYFYITLAWFCNLMYLISFFIEDNFNSSYKIILFDKEWSVLLLVAILFDLLAAVFFFIGGSKEKPFKDIRRHILIQSFLLLALLAFVFTLLKYHNNDRYILITLIDVLGLTVFSNYVYNTIRLARINFVLIGALLYTIAQFLSLINFDYEYGFLLGFISKSIILYGFYRVFLQKAEEKINLSHVNVVLKQLLGTTFHELAKPINLMEENLDALIENDKVVVYNPKAKVKIDSMNNAFQRMRAIFLASLDIYEEETEQELDKSIYIKKKLSSRAISLNNLVEQGFLNAKANRTKKINYHNQYAGNSDIICNKYEVVEAITNIINNAIEAVDSSGNVFVMTKGANFRGVNYIQLSVIDDGPGIPKDIQDKVTDIGVTTKKGDGHGFGLFIANKMIKKNDGFLEIESPYISRINKDKKRGTLIRVSFRKFRE